MDHWTKATIDRLTAEAPSFADRALLQELGKLMNEQEQRIAQAKAELDGRAWAKRKW